MRFIPHVIVGLLLLLLPPILSILMGLTAFGCYTAIIIVSFKTYAPTGIYLTIPEAARLAARDVCNLLKF